jgi:hypothetical protein
MSRFIKLRGHVLQQKIVNVPVERKVRQTVTRHVAHGKECDGCITLNVQVFTEAGTVKGEWNDLIAAAAC